MEKGMMKTNPAMNGTYDNKALFVRASHTRLVFLDDPSLQQPALQPPLLLVIFLPPFQSPFFRSGQMAARVEIYTT